MMKEFVLHLNKNIAKYGFVGAIKKLTHSYGIKIIVKSNDEIDEILTKGSGVLVASHPAEFDVLAILAAIKNRKDVFLIINSHFTKLMPNLDKNLIPVYVYNKSKGNFGGKLKAEIFNFFHRIEKLSGDEGRKKNIESIKLAVEKINNGGLVIIFPDGGTKKEWFNGVGYLIHGVKNIKNSFVLRAHIKGTSNWDWLRLIPIMNKFLPNFKVNFAKPLKMDLIKQEDQRKTTKFLEKKYWRWLGSLNLWSGLSKNYAWLKTLFLFLITKPY
jgi:hypothetical protein